MGKLRFLLFLLCFYNCADAQIQWVQSTWGNQQFDFTVDKVGNSYITGLLGATTTYQNITLPWAGAYFARYSSTGQLLCATGSTGAEDVIGRKIVTDNMGNMYAAGEFGYPVPQNDQPFTIGNLSIPVSTLFTNVYFVKLDSTGNAIWLKSIGGDNSTYVSDLTIDDSSNLYLTCYFDNPFKLEGISLSGGTFLAKYNSSGDLLWIDTNMCSIWGGARVKLDHEGNLIYAETFQNTISCDDTSFSAIGGGSEDIYVEKKSSAGESKWIQHIKNGMLGQYEYLLDYKIDNNNNIYLLTNLTDSIFISDSLIALPSSGNYLIKFDPDGGLNWIKSIPQQDTLVFSGQFIYISKDDSLHCVASKYYADSLYEYFDSTYFYYAWEITDSDRGFYDFVINKKTGNTVSSNVLIGIIDIGSPLLKNDGNDNLYMYGSFFSSITFDTTTLTNSFYGQYLLKYSNTITAVQTVQPSNPFLIMPNPASDVVYVIPGTEEQFSITLIDLEGKPVRYLNNSIGKTEINVSELASGVYILGLQDNQHDVYYTRIVKQR